MSSRIPRALGTTCLAGTFLLIPASVGIHLLSRHAAWFADTMYKKGGLHETGAEDLHKHLVDAMWAIHTWHIRYLVAITVLVAALGAVLVLYSRAIDRLEVAINGTPNQPLQGTPAKAPSSSTEPDGRRS